MAGEVIGRVAFVGLGHMGSHMCRHVCEAGFEVAAYDLSAAAVERAGRAGARPAPSLASCVEGVDALICSLPGPPQVQAVLEEAIPLLKRGSLVVEMSTSSLSVGRRAAELCAERGVSLLDAPVAGQTIGAEAGTLAIYVGGPEAAFQRALPLLEAMGERARILHVGEGGAGYVVKLLLNLTWFAQAVLTAEVLTMGVRGGVSLERLHAALVASPANSVFLERDVRMVLDDGDYDEGFPMRLVTKDLGLAIELARDVGVPVELSGLVEQIHRRARAVYGDEAGEISVVRLYEDLAELQLRFS